jgi:hypothetical protein
MERRGTGSTIETRALECALAAAAALLAADEVHAALEPLGTILRWLFGL